MKKSVFPAMIRLFLGVFIAGSILLFVFQFIGIDVSSEGDLTSKFLRVAKEIDWWIVFGVSATAGLLVALVGALRNTPIAKSLDTRDDH